MSDEGPTAGVQRSRLSGRTRVLVLAGLLVGASAVAWTWYNVRSVAPHPHHETEVSSQSRQSPYLFYPTAEQWTALTVEPVERRGFRPDRATEGKIAVNEDRSTLIFSPHAGRVTKLLVKPGDTVERGQPLLTLEATDVVQLQNDFLAAIGAVNKARSQLRLAQIIEKRTHDLYEGKALPLREWQHAQNELTGARNDLRSAEAALEAVRNRLRIQGRTDAEIALFQEHGKLSSETPIVAPIGGTVIERKAGPGQYFSAGSAEPVFVIGDLTTVWLVAYVREADASRIRLGQSLQFTVPAYPGQTFEAKADYVAAALDPTSRRLLVRATVDNQSGRLKPEMFANVTIFTDEGELALAVPRDSIIYDGDIARVWVVHGGKALELRRVKLGLNNGKMMQTLEGLELGEKVITKGARSIGSAAAGS